MGLGEVSGSWLTFGGTNIFCQLKKNEDGKEKKILRLYLFIFIERRRKGESEGEKHQCVVASHTPPTGDLAHNPGMCPDGELNWRPFLSQPELNPLSYSSQEIYIFLVKEIPPYASDSRN